MPVLYKHIVFCLVALAMLSCRKQYEVGDFLQYIESQSGFYKESVDGDISLVIKYIPAECLALKEAYTTSIDRYRYKETLEKFEKNYTYHLVIKGMNALQISMLTNSINSGEYPWIKLAGESPVVVEVESLSPQTKVMKLLCMFPKAKIKIEKKAVLEVILNSLSTFYYDKELIDQNYSIKF